LSTVPARMAPPTSPQTRFFSLDNRAQADMAIVAAVGDDNNNGCRLGRCGGRNDDSSDAGPVNNVV
jgi:hypothetical protein